MLYSDKVKVFSQFKSSGDVVTRKENSVAAITTGGFRRVIQPGHKTTIVKDR
jgi:hypothetical protein